MDNLKLYKLVVLYILNRVDFPLTNSQISEFILEQGYTSYFKIQQTFSELLDSGFITQELTHGRTLYHLTPQGGQTLSFFETDLPKGIRRDIHIFLKEKQYQLRDEVSIFADYFRNPETSEYIVTCSVREKNTSLIHLELSLPDEEEAKQVVNNWRVKNQEIYAHIIEKLL